MSDRRVRLHAVDGRCGAWLVLAYGVCCKHKSCSMMLAGPLCGMRATCVRLHAVSGPCGVCQALFSDACSKTKSLCKTRARAARTRSEPELRLCCPELCVGEKASLAPGHQLLQLLKPCLAHGSSHKAAWSLLCDAAGWGEGIIGRDRQWHGGPAESHGEYPPAASHWMRHRSRKAPDRPLHASGRHRARGHGGRGR